MKLSSTTSCLCLLILSAIPGRIGPPQEKGPFRKPDLVELVLLEPTIRLDIRYATPDNLVGRQVYTQARAFLQRPAAEALQRVHRALKQYGYGLLVFDGYRPWSVTKIFWDLTPPEKRAFVADPAEGSKHNRGCAVDLSLYDLATGLEVEMPSAYDETTERASPGYSGGTPEQRAHRDLLRRAMEREGFTVEPNEWWHYNFKDWRAYPILDIPFERLGVGGREPVGPARGEAPRRRIEFRGPGQEARHRSPPLPAHVGG